MLSIKNLNYTVETEKGQLDILKNNKIHFFIHSMAVSDYTIDYVTCIKYLDKEFKSNIYIGGTAYRALNKSLFFQTEGILLL